ncbi:hypothetical protein RND81_05G198800 [Saponaria officinalis]|uniref:Peptidase A1 domain-containing protein n=1 Tax=Saponaria officinalis TaxID=3572 RepID=A0AAW1L2N4_SAPOF
MNPLIMSLMLLFLFNTSTMSYNFLKMDVIPPTFPESPFYDRNVRYQEMISAATNQSNYRASKYYHKPNHLSLDGVPQPQVHHHPLSLYSVRVGLGTPAKYYNLALDTGSNLIWLQCHECLNPPNKYFCQHGEQPYNCNLSDSCNLLNCSLNRSICLYERDCDGQLCQYDISYRDGSHTRGYLATESFTFKGFNNNEGKYSLVFGCGTSQKNFYMSNGITPNEIAGIMGISMGTHSLISQLKTFRWFSHSLCSTKTTYLTFGHELELHVSSYQQTALYINKGHYYVELSDIIVNGETFNIRNNVVGGPHLAVTDTGTPVTRLFKPYFTMVAQKLGQMYQQKSMFENTLCYRWNPNHILPTITLVLGKAELRIQSEDAYTIFTDSDRGPILCLWMQPDDQMTIIGARALTNHEIVYYRKQQSNTLYIRSNAC